MVDDGMTQREVTGRLGGRQTGCVPECHPQSDETLQRNWPVPQETSPRSFTCDNRRQDRYLTTVAARNRFRTARLLRNDFHDATDVRVSTQPVRNGLHAAGLYARRPNMVVPLTAALCSRTSQLRNWTPVLFTDESRFCLDSTNDKRLGSGGPRELVLMKRTWLKMTGLVLGQ